MVTRKNSSNHNSTFFGYILTGGKKAFSLIRRSGFLAWIKASQDFATGKYYCHKFLGFYGIELAQWGQVFYEVKFMFLKRGDSTKSFLKSQKVFREIGCVDENSNTTSQLLWRHCEEFDLISVGKFWFKLIIYNKLVESTTSGSSAQKSG